MLLDANSLYLLLYFKISNIPFVLQLEVWLFAPEFPTLAGGKQCPSRVGSHLSGTTAPYWHTSGQSQVKINQHLKYLLAKKDQKIGYPNENIHLVSDLWWWYFFQSNWVRMWAWVIAYLNVPDSSQGQKRQYRVHCDLGSRLGYHLVLQWETHWPRTIPSGSGEWIHLQSNTCYKEW